MGLAFEKKNVLFYLELKLFTTLVFVFIVIHWMNTTFQLFRTKSCGIRLTKV